MLYFTPLASHDQDNPVLKIQNTLQQTCKELAQKSQTFNRALSEYKKEMKRDLNRGYFANDQETCCCHEAPEFYFPKLNLVTNSIKRTPRVFNQTLGEQVFDLYKRLTFLIMEFCTALVNSITKDTLDYSDRSNIKRITFELGDIKLTCSSSHNLFNPDSPEKKNRLSVGDRFYLQDHDSTAFEIECQEESTELDVTNLKDTNALSLHFSFNDDQTVQDFVTLKQDSDELQKYTKRELQV